MERFSSVFQQTKSSKGNGYKNPYKTYSLYTAKLHNLLWVLVVYGITLFLEVSNDDSTTLRLVLFTYLIIVHLLFYWFSTLVNNQWQWLYILLQGLLISFAAYLVPVGFPAVLIGLFALLVAQSVGIFYRFFKISVVFFYCLILFIYHITWLGTPEEFTLYLLIMIPIMILVVSYAVSFFKQVNARISTQSLLNELEMTHSKVEELTLINERQRMARDLHDTLAQGLAGISMQLEAINYHLEKKDLQKAQIIVNRSSQQVKHSLHDARSAIDNLRNSANKGDINLSTLLQKEISNFELKTGTPCTLKMPPALSLSNTISEHIYRIVSEALSNVIRHARADQVSVEIERRNDLLTLIIEDDGRGFHPNRYKPGHYGLLGLKERARLLGGDLNIESGIGKGTIVKVTFPITNESEG